MTPLEPVQFDLDLLDRVFHPSLCTTDPESGTWCGSSWKPFCPKYGSWSKTAVAS